MNCEEGNAFDPHSEGGATSGPAAKRPRTEGPKGPKKAERRGQRTKVKVGDGSLPATVGRAVAVVSTGPRTNYNKVYFVRLEDDQEYERCYTREDLGRIAKGQTDVLEDRVNVARTEDIRGALQKLIKQAVINADSLAAIQEMVPVFVEDPAVTELRDALESGREARARLSAIINELEQMAKCPITLDTLEDPVTCNACGGTVCANALFEALKDKTDPSCPLCRAPSKLAVRDCTCGTRNASIHEHTEGCRNGMIKAAINGGCFAPNRLAKDLMEVVRKQRGETEPEPGSPALL